MYIAQAEVSADSGAGIGKEPEAVAGYSVYPVAAAKAQFSHEISASFQIFVKIGSGQVVLIGSGETAVLGEVIRRCTQLMPLNQANIQLISGNDARVVRNDATFAEVHSAGHTCLKVELGSAGGMWFCSCLRPNVESEPKHQNVQMRAVEGAVKEQEVSAPSGAGGPLSIEHRTSVGQCDAVVATGWTEGTRRAPDANPRTLDAGHSGSHWSIPVGLLRPLLRTIENDIKAWILKEKPVSFGQPVQLDGKSYAFTEYFKQNRIDPKFDPRYSEYYVHQRHTIAGSYVWGDSTLSEFADELEKPIHSGKLCWIDVLINCQFRIDNVVGLTGDIYNGCEVLILLSKTIFKRAWCLLEAANYTTKGCTIFVVGQCSFLQGEDYFAAMEATVPSDKCLIADEIAKMFGAGYQAKFNRAIDDAVVQVYGESLLYNGRFQEAVPVFERELDVKRRRGDDKGSIASTYIQMGRASGSLGNYAVALRYYEEALQHNVLHFGTGHVSVASTQNNIAIVLKRQGKFDEALKMYEKALKTKIQALGPNHVAATLSVAATYKNMGVVEMTLGNLEKALELYEKALEIELKSLGSGHVSVADTKQNIGIVYSKLGNLSKRLELYREAHSIYLQALGPEHPKTKGIAPFI